MNLFCNFKYELIADDTRRSALSLNISPKIDLGRRLICDRQVSLNFQAAYMDQIMI